MAQSSWPSPDDSRVVSDLQYEHMVAPQHVDGLVGDPTDAPLVSADGSAMSVTLAASRYAYVRGHGWTSGTPAPALAIGANSSGSTRIDLVVLGLDRSTWNVTAYVKAGTAGAGAPPDLQQDTGDTGKFEIPLAEVTVLNGAAVIASDKVKIRHWWARPFGAASTGPDTRPVTLGLGGLTTEGGDLLAWNGTRWVNITSPPTTVQAAQSADFAGSHLVGDSTWRDIPASYWPRMSFTVPASGKVWLSVSATIQNTASSSAVIAASYRGTGGGIPTGVNSGDSVKRGLNTVGTRLGATKRTLFTGLTPGATVTLTPIYTASTVSSNTSVTKITDGTLTMEPAL